MSWRVVKTLIAPSPSTMGNVMWQPRLLPIQFRCMVRTRSGQPGKSVAIIQQLFHVGGNLEKPLIQKFLTHFRFASPAESRLDLFICEDGLASGSTS